MQVFQNKNVIRMIKYFFRNKKATLYSCIMCVLGLAVGIITPICNKMIQNDIIPNRNIQLFVWLTIIIFILNLVSILASFMNTKIMTDNGVPITSNIRKDIVKMNTLSNKNEKNKGKIIVSSTVYLENANSFYISYMYLVYDCLLKFMFYFPFFLIYGKGLALIMLVTIVVSIAVVDAIAIMAKKLVRVSRIVDTERYTYATNLLKQLKKNDFQESEEYNFEGYHAYVKKCDRAWINYCMFANLYTYAFSLIWNIGLVICYALAFGMMQAGSLVIATFIVFNSYCDQLRTPVANFISFKMITDQYDATFNKIFEMLDDEDLVELKKK